MLPKEILDAGVKKITQGKGSPRKDCLMSWRKRRIWITKE